MKQRPLGKTALSVSEIGFGGVEIGMPYGFKNPCDAEMPTEEESLNLLCAALDNGINYYDTARLYGKSEEILGRAFHNRRKEVVLATKCRHLRNPDNTLIPNNCLPGFINDSLQESLHFLCTDHVDIFMVHNADLDILANPVVAEAFLALKNKGLATYIGVSTYTVAETRAAIAAGTWDIIQLPFNLMDQRQGRLFAAAAAKGIAIIVRSALFRGILTGKGQHLHPALKAVEEHRSAYLSLLNDDIPELTDLAIKFALAQPEVSSVLIGIDRIEYLEKAVHISRTPQLSPVLLNQLRQMEFPNLQFLDLPAWHEKGWI